MYGASWETRASICTYERVLNGYPELKGIRWCSIRVMLEVWARGGFRLLVSSTLYSGLWVEIYSFRLPLQRHSPCDGIHFAWPFGVRTNLFSEEFYPA